jgi:hypothetical protein
VLFPALAFVMFAPVPQKVRKDALLRSIKASGRRHRTKLQDRVDPFVVAAAIFRIPSPTSVASWAQKAGFECLKVAIVEAHPSMGEVAAEAGSKLFALHLKQAKANLTRRPVQGR